MSKKYKNTTVKIFNMGMLCINRKKYKTDFAEWILQNCHSLNKCRLRQNGHDFLWNL